MDGALTIDVLAAPRPSRQRYLILNAMDKRQRAVITKAPTIALPKPPLADDLRQVWNMLPLTNGDEASGDDL
jgi:hypothetical protein